MAIIIALLCFAAVYKLQGDIYKKLWNKNLKIDLQFQTLECAEGERNLLKEVITNAKRLPLPVLHVKFRTSRTFLFENEDNSAISDYYYRDDIFAVRGWQIVTRNLSFLCSKRGCYSINDTSLVSTDLFLELILSECTSNDSFLYVYPRKLDMSEFEIPYESITGQFLSNDRLIEDPFEFRGIRNYQPYDNMRSINWKSSARNNELLVNTYFTTASRNIKLYLNLEKHALLTEDEILEAAIRIASTLAFRFLSDHIPLSLETNGVDLFTKERISIGSGAGNGHSIAIDRCLARIDLSKRPFGFMSLLENIYSSAENNTYYIIISNSRKPDITEFYSRLKADKIPCCYIIPDKKTAKPESLQADMFWWEVPMNE